MSGKYLAARNAFGEGRLSLINDRILAQLVSADYRFDEKHAPHDLTGAVGDPVELSEKEISDGWFRFAALTFSQVRGHEVSAVVLRTDVMLIEYHDAIENFPLQPNGGDIEVEVFNPGIFRL